MFTVKIVRKSMRLLVATSDDTEEQILEAYSVSLTGAGLRLETEEGGLTINSSGFINTDEQLSRQGGTARECVSSDAPRKSLGKVYVMNRFGATVATYDL